MLITPGFGPTGPQGVQGVGGVSGPTGPTGGPSGPAGPQGPGVAWVQSDHGFFDWNGDPFGALGAVSLAAMLFCKVKCQVGGSVGGLYAIISGGGNTFSAPLSTNVTGTAANGFGEIRLSVVNSSGFSTGQVAIVQNVAGTVEANNSWPIAVIDPTHIDLIGSTFVNPWLVGGSIYISSNCMGLYTSGGAFMAASTDMTGFWITGNGCRRAPFVTPVTTTPGNDYYVVMMSKASVLPTFNAFSNVFAANCNSSGFTPSGTDLLFANNPAGTGAVALPASFTPASNTLPSSNSQTVWVATGP